ncbi:hypothetical protein VIBNISO65_420002 [Vibrio nigripulchritudo SO65]|nr:hypothetical protein VIBNIAM115_730021 [Vibrio nigripulchritudo AM115]CCN44763.1 hypothetical protein VIBNIFTn2_900002 [Vibrio nigripulchritudo FTn2]CCN62917.1 hypothetical protein VIBNIPon4_1040021 [Vibrio nigripulchritudo POn4]CCN77867.1 hypothetical protein VIBNISO65_420002 [Vibrio nigripulchritudo SO65]
MSVAETRRLAEHLIQPEYQPTIVKTPKREPDTRIHHAFSPEDLIVIVPRLV